MRTLSHPVRLGLGLLVVCAATLDNPARDTRAYSESEATPCDARGGCGAYGAATATGLKEPSEVALMVIAAEALGLLPPVNVINAAPPRFAESLREPLNRSTLLAPRDTQPCWMSPTIQLPERRPRALRRAYRTVAASNAGRRHQVRLASLVAQQPVLPNRSAAELRYVAGRH